MERHDSCNYRAYCACRKKAAQESAAAKEAAAEAAREEIGGVEGPFAWAAGAGDMYLGSGAWLRLYTDSGDEPPIGMREFVRSALQDKLDTLLQAAYGG